jgi:hypothetical protein
MGKHYFILDSFLTDIRDRVRHGQAFVNSCTQHSKKVRDKGLHNFGAPTSLTLAQHYDQCKQSNAQYALYMPNTSVVDLLRVVLGPGVEPEEALHQLYQHLQLPGCQEDCLSSVYRTLWDGDQSGPADFLVGSSASYSSPHKVRACKGVPHMVNFCTWNSFKDHSSACMLLQALVPRCVLSFSFHTCSCRILLGGSVPG